MQNNTAAIPSFSQLNQIDIKCKLKNTLKLKYYDIIRNNLPLLFLYSLLYLDFNNASYKDYSD